MHKRASIVVAGLVCEVELAKCLRWEASGSYAGKLLLVAGYESEGAAIVAWRCAVESLVAGDYNQFDSSL